MCKWAEISSARERNSTLYKDADLGERRRDEACDWGELVSDFEADPELMDESERLEKPER